MYNLGKHVAYLKTNFSTKVQVVFSK